MKNGKNYINITITNLANLMTIKTKTTIFFKLFGMTFYTGI